MEEMAGKQPHEAFEKYFNAELKEMIVTEIIEELLKNVFWKKGKTLAY